MATDALLAICYLSFVVVLWLYGMADWYCYAFLKFTPQRKREVLVILGCGLVWPLMIAFLCGAVIGAKVRKVIKR